jgi:hypothetical protein
MSETAGKWADLAERAIWTLAEAGIGVAVVELAGIPQVWAVPIAGALAAVKGALAQKFGNESAATLPVALEPTPAGAVAASSGDAATE